MDKMTITEALSEVNLIKKKVEKARDLVLGNIVRAKHLKDPYETTGGSRAANASLVQSITDLDGRLVRIRYAIARANQENSITIGGQTRSIHDWLTWKREVAESEIKLMNDIYGRVKQHNDQAARQPQVYKDDDGKTHLVEYEVNVDYPEFVKKAETLADTLEKLDGQLSLKNATIVVEI